ncbi:metallophosphoesterase family protein [Mariniflexile sp. AS56]|uniref:metallophosphoesterase family protein n=1 Tax=Mariniflexile sp. AS56 TaxID=3063957 RepID=UPI0026EE8675|nr:metallophosphoesterase [Mariniflexile sp. AS56]MDO7171666.1 metallophosphoesterase [Mariniflexile sp. AS56]
MRFQKKALLVLSVLVLVSCAKKLKPELKDVQIAFIADAHFQDIFAEFEDANYKGIKNPETGAYVNIRTMQAQLTSTRLFNENYFAFFAALDDIVARGIKYVALPGDFSDDGQPVHVKGLRNILDAYAAKHGILFFATTGNHDPVKPFTQDAGKTDFLGEGGKEQIITSSSENLKAEVDGQLKPIITSEIKKWGYKDVLNEMASFGFYPQKEYLYWETPFSTYNYKNYRFQKAKKESSINQRVYPVDAHNFHPDASYMVEPTPGLWLLAIDANVYMPNKDLIGFSENPKDFSGARIGYNQVLLQKSHLIAWVKKVSDQAKKEGKVLIAFSHYPMVDFNDDASPEMTQFFGDEKMQLHRVPKEEVAKTFADAGIQIHFGGHMHINDTGVRTSDNGHTLFNIQSPSLAAYMPAYKILSIKNKQEFEVETVVIDSVPNFNSLFPLYEQEYAHLNTIKSATIWDKDILNSKSYKAFTQWHLKELLRLRFLPDDWPVALSETLLKASGTELLLINTSNKAKINEQLALEKLPLNQFETWTGFDMIFDFYRLRSADALAFPDIGATRLKQYALVCDQMKQSDDALFQLWGTIFEKSRNGQPSNHFKIDLGSKTIESINE